MKKPLIYIFSFGLFLFLIFGNLNMLISSVESEINKGRIPLKFHESNNYIGLLAALDNPYFYYNESDRIAYFYTAVQSAVYKPENTERTPLNISIVIDRSGSMAGDKIAYVKRAAIFVIDQLNSDDYVSIVTYDNEINVLHRSSNVRFKGLIKNKIESINTGRTTNLGGGMLEGFNQVKNNFKAGYVNRVFLLSDGRANVGITDIELLQQIAGAKNIEESISISSFGVGMDFNEDLMTGIAENGRGNYYFISNPEDIPGIFAKELKGLNNLVAQNAKLEITLPDNIKPDHIFGQKYIKRANKVTIYLNDIFSEEIKSCLFRFILSENADNDYVFKAKLTYYDATGDKLELKEITTDLKLSKTKDFEVYNNGKNEKVVEQIVIYESNFLLEEAMKEADYRNFEKVREILQENSGYLEKHDHLIQNNPTIRRQRDINSIYEKIMENAENMDYNELNEAQKSTKSENYKIRNNKD